MKPTAMRSRARTKRAGLEVTTADAGRGMSVLSGRICGWGRASEARRLWVNARRRLPAERAARRPCFIIHCSNPTMPGACHRARSAAGPHEANGPSSKRLRDTGRTAGWRDKTRPTSPLPRPIREKTRPASPKTPNVGCCERAGRTFSRSHPPSGPAGRTISRTGRSGVAAQQPTTPLQPLTRASMKPPSPLRAPEQQPLKPVAPLQPKNAPNAPISHPQRQ